MTEAASRISVALARCKMLVVIEIGSLVLRSQAGIWSVADKNYCNIPHN